MDYAMPQSYILRSKTVTELHTVTVTHVTL